MTRTLKKGQILSVIGDQDTVVGFLLGGIGEISDNREENYFIVERNTTTFEIEEAFNRFVKRKDIAIIIINQKVADLIRQTIDHYKGSIPAIVEVPSKDSPYDVSKDSFLNRARNIFQIENFMEF